MDREKIQVDLISTTFVNSFIGMCISGDINAASHKERAQALGSWCVQSLGYFTGVQERGYVAIKLPGEFYDPKGIGGNLKPHLELSEKLLNSSDPQFPDRLAILGNGIGFKWWVLPEIYAIKRVLLKDGYGDVRVFALSLDKHREELLNALNEQSSRMQSAWGKVSEEIVTNPEGFGDYLYAPFSANEINYYFPSVISKTLSISLDEKLRDADRSRTARRVGVWLVKGKDFAVGCITPRLTYSSNFVDEVFKPEGESSLALLIRGLIMNRLSQRYLGDSNVSVVVKSPLNTHLKKLPAKIGQKIPESSVTSGVRFVTDFPDPLTAWSKLSTWCGEELIITVSYESFANSHSKILNMISKIEEVEQDDINNVLPLVWSGTGKIIRVTYSRN